MPPPIFGRRTDQPEKNGAGADNKLGLAKVCSYRLTGRQGFEPRLADPESAVLPLDDLPTQPDNTGFVIIKKQAPRTK